MKIKILNIEVDKTSKDEVLSRVSSFLKEKHKFLIVTPNPEICLAAYNDQKLLSIINNADIAIPDGIGLKLKDLSLGVIKGRQLMVNLFDLANEKNLKIYLLGATESINKKAVEKVSINYPNLYVSGLSGPKLNIKGEPINQDEERKEKRVLTEVNRFKPDLLFVAFGAPKQEYWSDRWLPKLNVGGIMVVGGALDYFVGESKVPRIMEFFGLEWLYRLAREPKRIGRIFNAVVIFPLKLILSK